MWMTYSNPDPHREDYLVLFWKVVDLIKMIKYDKVTYDKKIITTRYANIKTEWQPRKKSAGYMWAKWWPRKKFAGNVKSVDMCVCIKKYNFHISMSYGSFKDGYVDKTKMTSTQLDTINCCKTVLYIMRLH
jgi:hypothetical protein